MSIPPGSRPARQADADDLRVEHIPGNSRSRAATPHRQPDRRGDTRANACPNARPHTTRNNDGALPARSS